jgi:hypothetical protein
VIVTPGAAARPVHVQEETVGARRPGQGDELAAQAPLGSAAFIRAHMGGGRADHRLMRPDQGGEGENVRAGAKEDEERPGVRPQFAPEGLLGLGGLR